MIYGCMLSVCMIQFVIFNKIYMQTRLCLALNPPWVTPCTKVQGKFVPYVCFVSFKTMNGLGHSLLTSGILVNQSLSDDAE